MDSPLRPFRPGELQPGFASNSSSCTMRAGRVAEASRAASSMRCSRTLTTASIADGGACHDLLEEVPAQVSSRAKIDLPPHYLRQFLFHPHQIEQSGNLVRLKLHQNVHVALRPESFRQHRAEQRQLANMVPDTKLLNQVFGNDNRQGIHRLTSTLEYAMADYHALKCSPAVRPCRPLYAPASKMPMYAPLRSCLLTGKYAIHRSVRNNGAGILSTSDPTASSTISKTIPANGALLVRNIRRCSSAFKAS